MKRLGLFVLGGALLCVTNSALAIVVDGTWDASYGAPLAVQTVQTEFGDAIPPDSLGGSELDAAYAKIEGGRLFLLLTGNHEPNFNKLEIFIDSKPGGENLLSGTPDYDFEPGDLNWISSNLNGFTFDSGFEADYHLFSRWGSGTSGYEVDFVDRDGGINNLVPGSAAVSPDAVGLIASGTVLAGALGPNASGTALTADLDFAINNNNTAGVIGGTLAADQAAAAAVTTGMEFSIALADIGSPGVGDVIKISAMINNGDHNFLSNQFLGGLSAPQGNIGGAVFGDDLFGIDMNDFDGDQFFEITVPALTDNADANNDGWIDGLDYLIWAAAFGDDPAADPPGSPANGDFDNSGAVTGLDYLVWAAQFGTHPGPVGAAVPEPGTFALAGLALVGLLAVRRRA